MIGATVLPGPRNLLTDVPGLLVGNAHDERLASGVTVVLVEGPATASGLVVGGAPGGRETDLLRPDTIATGVDAVVLAGGSTFGLDAATGVQAYLHEKGVGLRVGDAVVPLATQAILFDLLNGGDKGWGRYPPYRELGFQACQLASTEFALGSVGAGYGATTVDLKGGLGSASAVTSRGYIVAALAAVNAIGSAVVGGGPHFWAAALEEAAEFGGRGPAPACASQGRLRWKGGEPATTLAVVATDAALTKAECRRLAGAAQGGLARALSLSHALFDGDTIFTIATGRRPLEDPIQDAIEIGATASHCVARAIARGVFEATALPFPGALPAWRDLFSPAG